MRFLLSRHPEIHRERWLFPIAIFGGFSGGGSDNQLRKPKGGWFQTQLLPSPRKGSLIGKSERKESLTKALNDNN
jgi:hypothetical protein